MLNTIDVSNINIYAKLGLRIFETKDGVSSQMYATHFWFYLFSIKKQNITPKLKRSLRNFVITFKLKN